MGILTDKLNAAFGRNSDIDWNPSEKWHEVRIVGVADLGEEANTYQDGKMQPKISVYLQFAETVTLGDSTINKTKCEKFTASLHERASIVSKLLAPAGISVESFDELLGQTLRVKIQKNDKWFNIVNADESETPLALADNMYVPKFWLVDKEGKETGYDILVEDGVKAELRPVVTTESTPTAVDTATDIDPEDIYK